MKKLPDSNNPTNWNDGAYFYKLPKYFQMVSTSDRLAKMLPFKDRIGNLFIGMSVQKRLRNMLKNMSRS